MQSPRQLDHTLLLDFRPKTETMVGGRTGTGEQHRFDRLSLNRSLFPRTNRSCTRMYDIIGGKPTGINNYKRSFFCGRMVAQTGAMDLLVNPLVRLNTWRECPPWRNEPVDKRPKTLPVIVLANSA